MRKNFNFGAKQQDDLAWLQEKIEASTEAETIRRLLHFARIVLESNDKNHIDIRRDSLPDLRVVI